MQIKTGYVGFALSSRENEWCKSVYSRKHRSSQSRSVGRRARCPGHRHQVWGEHKSRNSTLTATFCAVTSFELLFLPWKKFSWI